MREKANVILKMSKAISWIKARKVEGDLKGIELATIAHQVARLGIAEQHTIFILFSP